MIRSGRKALDLSGWPRWRLRVLVLVTLSGSLLGVAAGVEAQGDEERAVIEAAQAVFDAMEALDPEAFRDSMVPEGFFLAVGFETTRRSTREEFTTRLSGATRPMYERMWDPEVRIDGPVATLWAPYDFYSAGEFSHCGTDAFQLAKTPRGWKVVMISYTVRMPPDCNTHPDGPPAGG
jgi:hypothetical protein